MRRTWVGSTWSMVSKLGYFSESNINLRESKVGKHTGYKAASGQVHFLVSAIKIPYSYQMMMSVQRILRMLTTDSLVKKVGICALNLSCPFRRRAWEIAMVNVQPILKCCNAARPNQIYQIATTSSYIIRDTVISLVPLESTRGLARNL